MLRLQLRLRQMVWLRLRLRLLLLRLQMGLSLLPLRLQLRLRLGAQAMAKAHADATTKAQATDKTAAHAKAVHEACLRRPQKYQRRPTRPCDGSATKSPLQVRRGPSHEMSNDWTLNP